MWLHRLKHRCVRIKQRAGRGSPLLEWSWGKEARHKIGKRENTRQKPNVNTVCVIACQHGAMGSTMGLGL